MSPAAICGKNWVMVHSLSDTVISRDSNLIGYKHSGRRKNIAQTICHTIVCAHYRFGHRQLAADIAFCQLFAGIVPICTEKNLIFVKGYAVLFKSLFAAGYSAM